MIGLLLRDGVRGRRAAAQKLTVSTGMIGQTSGRVMWVDAEHVPECHVAVRDRAVGWGPFRQAVVHLGLCDESACGLPSGCERIEGWHSSAMCFLTGVQS